MSEAQFKLDFQKYMYRDADRVFKKYPALWNSNIVLTEFFQNIQRILAGDNHDTAALLAYYKSQARSKDATRIFQVVARECIVHHGYGPDQCHYLAVWYFVIVKLTEYDDKIGINENTDIVGMYQCYLNTGDIDYEYDWSN